MGKRYGLKTPLLEGSGSFAKTFAANEEKATYRAQGTLNGVTVKVASQNEEHYQRTLECWRKWKVTNIVEKVLQEI